MVDDDLVVQRLVAVVQLFEVDVLVEVVVESTHLLVGACGLLFKRFDSCGKTTHQPEALALIEGEGGPTVGLRIGNDLGFCWHQRLLSGSCFQRKPVARRCPCLSFGILSAGSQECAAS